MRRLGLSLDEPVLASGLERVAADIAADMLCLGCGLKHKVAVNSN